MKSDGLKIYI